MTVATFAEKNRVLYICVCMYVCMYVYIYYILYIFVLSLGGTHPRCTCLWKLCMPSSGSMPNLSHANLVFIFCYSRVSALHNTFGANKNYPAANIGRKEEAANIKKQDRNYKLLVSGSKC